MLKKNKIEIGEEFKRLKSNEKEVIRNEARKRLKGMGWEEVGSADIFCMIAEIYRENESFMNFLEKEIEFQVKGYYS